MRVIDKRMFNADGELREDVKRELEEFASHPPPPLIAAVPETPVTAPPEPPRKGAAVKSVKLKEVVPVESDLAADPVKAGPPDPNFVRLIMTLSNQAGLFLGLLVDPLNPAGTLDLPTAKTFIDMLSTIEDKTQGRLNTEESQLLESVLYELKMAYVERTRRPARA